MVLGGFSDMSKAPASHEQSSSVSQVELQRLTSRAPAPHDGFSDTSKAPASHE